MKTTRPWHYCLMAGWVLIVTSLMAPPSHAAVGDLDPSFGNEGKVTTSFTSTSFEQINALTVQPDGKILVVGEGAGLARYHSNGNLDTDFGNGGFATTVFQYSDVANDVVLQPDGKIIVGGSTERGSTGGIPDSNFVFARYNTDGSLDPSFGSSGKQITSFPFTGSVARMNAIALQPDDKIIAVGRVEDHFTVVRYNSDGSVDSAFGSGGKTTTTIGSLSSEARDIALQPDGKLLVGGYSTIGFTVARYNANGSLETVFGSGGSGTPIEVGSYINAIALQPDGKIVAVGGGNGGFTLARYHSNGDLDLGFGSGGIVTTDFADAPYSYAYDLVLQPDGKIVVAGAPDPGLCFAVGLCGGHEFLLSRYNSDGSLDLSFSTDGKLETVFYSQIYPGTIGGEAHALALQPDGKLIAAGIASTDTSSHDFALARYLNDSGLPQPGWWWNPNESGRGFSIEVSQNTLVMAGYLYDSSGRATWYTSAGPITNNTLYQGPLQSFGNGQTLSGPYKLYSPTNPNAGTITIQFSDATHGTLTWPGGTIPIERYVFGAGASSFQPESGWWWNESESGRGFTLEVQGNKLVIGGYMYDDSGNPVWYLSAGNMTSAMLYQGKWEQYANGQILTGTYKKPDQVNGNVGSITIQFTSRTTAALILPDGRQIPLTRYRF